jgi:FAD/FMN-containing dehydrogenase
MAGFYANASCDPFTPRDAQCVIGAYVQYAVKALSVSDYQKTLAFAQQRNIRLVVRNTGHDYFGKSTGPGALALWTHFLKDIKVVDYKSKDYTGKAMRLGAGVQVFEATAAAHDQGLVVVGGDCSTVGIAGGYTQGGGHGPLASKFGLGADQVLEWEVVTALGLHLVATPTQNSDLYWALSGGGGGTYAAVLSMTVKAYPDLTVSAATLIFSRGSASKVAFWSVIQTFLINLPRIVDSGAVSIWFLLGETFVMQPTTAPSLTQAQLQALMDPTLAKLNQTGIPYGKLISIISSSLVQAANRG